MNIYFSGIGGVGIGPLAMLAQDAGHEISGSDLELSPTAKDLVERGAKVSTDQSGEFMDAINKEKTIDLFVYTAALPEDHPELKYAREYSITSVKRHELIKQLIKYKNLKLVAVSGTHGKTTATGMLIWVFHELNTPISYSVGTRLSFGEAAKYDSKSELFVYEADEFDRNMLEFEPYMAVITSLDYDHPDTYENEQSYHRAFQQFAEQSEKVVAWKNANLTGNNIKSIEKINSSIGLPGHNKANATLVFEAVKLLVPDVDESDILATINTFPGTSRRFEEISENLFSDYAHHPKEIASTISMAKELGRPVVIVYQPHQNIRQHQLVNNGGYSNCFEDAKKVYWIPTYRSREDKTLRMLNPEELIKSTSNQEIIETADMNEKLENNIKQHLADGDLVIAMSAGDLDDWVRALADNN